MILALILSFEAVAEPVAKALGVAKDKLRNGAQVVLAVAIGLYLISAGVAALAVPVVGIILIVVGVALLAWAAWPLFKKSGPEKPDNTKL